MDKVIEVVAGALMGIVAVLGMGAMTGCGEVYLGFHPTTSASHETRYEPQKLRCVFGSCPSKEEAGS